MKKLTDCLTYGLLAIMLLNVFWDDFPTLSALYALLTLTSLLLGITCLRGTFHAEKWDAWGVGAARQLRFLRLLGALFLLNAAVGPVGLLVRQAVDFDQDFLLLAQMLGLPLIAALSVLPKFLVNKEYE